MKKVSCENISTEKQPEVILKSSQKNWSLLISLIIFSNIITLLILRRAGLFRKMNLE